MPLRPYLIAIIGMCLSACTSPSLNDPVSITPATAMPTTAPAQLCTLGQDGTAAWDVRLTALQTLYDRGDQCDTDIRQLLYLTYVTYGDVMAGNGERQIALDLYYQALRYDDTARAAHDGIARLQLTDDVIVRQCDDGKQADPLPEYVNHDGNFASLGETNMLIDGQAFPIYGVNYYPRDTPFDLFLTESDLDAMDDEIGLIAASGLNTLRIFVHSADLFACDAVVPLDAPFARLDGIIHLAAQHNLRLIMVLNQAVPADILYYADFPRWQMQFIVQRYRDEPTILAWDLRHQGNNDYTSGTVPRQAVLTWLATSYRTLRQIDSAHLITAGWSNDSLDTAPIVDFVSFQSFGDYATLRQMIANLRAGTDRPLLLSAIGYSTFTVDEIVQRNLLYQSLEEVVHNELMGWAVWQAFDYPRTVTCIPPACPGNGREIDHYGLWNTGYFPKLAVDAVEHTIGLQN